MERRYRVLTADVAGLHHDRNPEVKLFVHCLVASRIHDAGAWPSDQGTSVGQEDPCPSICCTTCGA